MLQRRGTKDMGDPAWTFRAAAHFDRRQKLFIPGRSLASGWIVDYRVEEGCMTGEEKEVPKPKTRLSIPAGTLVILPRRNMVLFPSTVMPLVVGRPSSLRAIEAAVRQQVPVGFVAQRDPAIEVPQAKDLFRVGTAADVLRMFGLPDGQRQIIIQGRQRFEIAEFLETDPFLVARVTMVAETVPHSKEFEARILNLRQEAARALSLLPEPMSELRTTIERIDNPLALIDMIASTLDLPLPEKQEILSVLDPEARAQRVSEKLARQIELLELSKKIGEQAKNRWTTLSANISCANN